MRAQEVYMFANDGENHTNNVKQLEEMKKALEECVRMGDAQLGSSEPWDPGLPGWVRSARGGKDQEDVGWLQDPCGWGGAEAGWKTWT